MSSIPEDSASQPRTSRDFPVPISLLIVLGLVLGVGGWWWQARGRDLPEVPAAHLPGDQNYLLPSSLLVEGEHHPLPDVEVPVPGRPEVPMPIPHTIYREVELKLNNKVVESPLTLSAGQHVTVEGVIRGNPKLPPSVSLSGGLAFVTRDTNKRGWSFRHYKFFHSNSSQRVGRFDGAFTLPDEPGEYVLAVLSTAEVGYEKIIPILIAAEYDLTLE
jgi:hypothetical protein